MPKIPKAWLLKPIKVVWRDHYGHGPEWVNIKDIDSSYAVFTSVGYLIAIYKDRIVLGSCLDTEKKMTGDLTVLVRSCIQEIGELSDAPRL